MQGAFRFLLAGIALVVVIGLGVVYYSLYQEPSPVPSGGDALRPGQAQDNAQKPAAGGDSSQCAVASPAAGFVSGQFTFRLSKDVFQPSPSLEKQVQDRYGSNVDLADWNDLKTILVNEDDVRKFIQDTGIRLQSSNYDCDNILVSRSGGETVQGLHYHLARHDGRAPPNWSVLDSIGSNDIHLGRWNHSGQALLRISQLH